MKRLVVLAAGLNGSPRKWNTLLEQLGQEDELAGSDWLVFNHYGFWNWRAFKYFFTHSVEQLALELKARIEQQWVAAIASGEPYEEVICIGHSVGGLMIRQAYLVAAGAYPRAAKSEIRWSETVSRFVLIASINRGFEIKNPLVSAITNLSNVTGCLPVIRNISRGSDFVTNLRISWIRYFSNMATEEPAMIQVLGTYDGIVKREDSIDLQAFPNGIQIDVPGANHDSIYRPSGKSPPALEEWMLRYRLLKWAILQCEPKRTVAVPDELHASVALGPLKLFRVKRRSEAAVVFIVHGIRDSNSGWARQLEDNIKMQTDGKFSVVRSTYGYFSAFNFFLPWLRRRNIRWFQDQYSYHFALNPTADFHFIGHSNGTYLLGESLKRVSSMQFRRVYLAGSVLPCEYPWQERFDLNQVDTLRNDRSCWDWPVGILCSGLRGLRMKDIGTGGFDGFQFDDDRTEEVYYYNGSHGEPLAKENQTSVLSFILEGDRTHPGHLLELSQTSARFRLISRMAPYVAPWLLVAVIGVAFALICLILWGAGWSSVLFWIKLIGVLLILYTLYALAKTG